MARALFARPVGGFPASAVGLDARESFRRSLEPQKHDPRIPVGSRVLHAKSLRRDDLGLGRLLDDDERAGREPAALAQRGERGPGEALVVGRIEEGEGERRRPRAPCRAASRRRARCASRRRAPGPRHWRAAARAPPRRCRRTARIRRRATAPRSPSAPEPAKRSTTRAPSTAPHGDGRGCRRSIRAGAPRSAGSRAKPAHEARALSACRRRRASLRGAAAAACRRACRRAAESGPRPRAGACRTACRPLATAGGLRSTTRAFRTACPRRAAESGLRRRAGACRTACRPSRDGGRPSPEDARFSNGRPSPRGGERPSPEGGRLPNGLPPSRDGGRPSPDDARFSNGLPPRRSGLPTRRAPSALGAPLARALAPRGLGRAPAQFLRRRHDPLDLDLAPLAVARRAALDAFARAARRPPRSRRAARKRACACAAPARARVPFSQVAPRGSGPPRSGRSRPPAQRRSPRLATGGGGGGGAA